MPEHKAAAATGERHTMDRNTAGPREGAARVVTLSGLPGAGKTTLAESLERQLGVARLSRDDIRHGRFGHLVENETAKLSAFARLLDELDLLLARGKAALVEGMPFSRPQEHRMIAAVAQRHRAGVINLWLDCPAELAKQRVLQDRLVGAHPMADRTPELVDAVAAHLRPPLPATVLDARLPREALLDQALAVLRPRLSLT